MGLTRNWCVHQCRQIVLLPVGLWCQKATVLNGRSCPVACRIYTEIEHLFWSAVNRVLAVRNFYACSDKRFSHGLVRARSTGVRQYGHSMFLGLQPEQDACSRLSTWRGLPTFVVYMLIWKNFCVHGILATMEVHSADGKHRWTITSYAKVAIVHLRSAWASERGNCKSVGRKVGGSIHSCTHQKGLQE